MKCSKCGAELEEGVAFCTACGTPTTANDDGDKTVLVSPDIANPGQPQGTPQPAQPSYGQPGMQTGFGQPNPTQPNYGQPGMQTGFGQPNPTQPNYGQPGMQTGFGQPNPTQPNYGQPGMQTGFGQPNPTQPNYGQPGMQTGFGQPNPMQPNYGQPGMYNQAPKPPKPPRKPLSGKAKAGIVGGAVGAVVLIVFFAVILPILLRAKLEGEYTYTDSWDDTYVAIFDGGTYLLYDDDGEIWEAGTYIIKDGKVIMTDIEGDETTGKFDAKDNKVRIYGDTYKSSDKKETIAFELTSDYLDNLKARVETAVNKILEDEDIYDEVYWSTAYIYDDDLLNPGSDFESRLADELDYSNDIILKTLMEGGYIEIDVYITYDGEIEISYYIY